MFSIDLKITLDFNFFISGNSKIENICFGFKKSSVSQTKTFIAHILTCNQVLPISAKGSLWINHFFPALTMRKNNRFKKLAKNGLNHHQQWV